MIRNAGQNLVANEAGFSLVELLVVTLIFSIVLTAASILFVAGQGAWTLIDTQITLQDQLRTTLQRLAFEVSESGEDLNDVHQVTLFDNTGVGGTDIIRFAVPICPCQVNGIDSDGEVKYWGAPASWGNSGCNTSYTVQANGKVDICHLPPGNPANETDLQVNENAVQAHLAHGDRIGACASCSPAAYNNHFVQYSVDGSNQLVRSVLNSGLVVVSQVVFAENISDFQVSLNGGQTVVNVSLSLTDTSAQGRVVTRSGTMNILLRNM